jgi:hypothetical protein
MVGFDRTRNMLLADEIGTKEHKSIGWTWNVALRATLAGWAAFARRGGWSRSRREKSGRGG